MCCILVEKATQTHQMTLPDDKPIVIFYLKEEKKTRQCSIILYLSSPDRKQTEDVSALEFSDTGLHTTTAKL